WPDVVALHQVTSSAWPLGPLQEELAAQGRISLDVFWHGNLLHWELGSAVLVGVGAPLAPVLWHAAKWCLLVPDLPLLAVGFLYFPLGFRNGPGFPGCWRHRLGVRNRQRHHRNTSYQAQKPPRSHLFPPLQRKALRTCSPRCPRMSSHGCP